MCLAKWCASLPENRWAPEKTVMLLFTQYVMTSVVRLIRGKCFFKFPTVCLIERTYVLSYNKFPESDD
jgi:hypothetical protein